MAKQPSSGDLYFRIGLEMRTTQNPDSPADYGNTEDAWVEQFVVRAGFKHLRGGEEVLAARLAGTHTQVITVRASDDTRLITTGWRAVDKRNGDIFNVRDVTPSDDRQWLDLLCQKGVAT